jgi:hypothetical protein
MKKTILTLALIFCFNTIYSQNRYDNGSTSTYTPGTIPSQGYYKAIAEGRIENIKSRISYYDDLVNKTLNSNIDQELRGNLREINKYLNALKNTERMSLDNAEWYLRTINRKYNKAIRKYNKRLKKKPQSY